MRQVGSQRTRDCVKKMTRLMIASSTRLVARCLFFIATRTIVDDDTLIA